MSTTNGPQAAFCVGVTGVNEAGISLQQQVSPTLVDHRGLVEMPAYAVMAESVTSGAYWYSFAEPVATVQSWLALTAGVRPTVGDRLHAVSVLAHHDDSYGTATMTVTDTAHEVVCSGVARAVRVGRSTEALRALDKDTIAAQSELRRRRRWTGKSRPSTPAGTAGGSWPRSAAVTSPADRCANCSP